MSAKLKERYVPFVVYSGFDQLEGACNYGIDVDKPASPSELVATVAGLLAGPPVSH